MTEPIKIDTNRIQAWMSPAPAPKHEGIRLLFIPLMLLTFIAGLFLGAKITDETDPADDPSFVDTEGHEGQVLVIGTDGGMRWTTEAELEAADHG